MRIYEAIAAALQREGATAAFALLGDSNMQVMAAFSELPGTTLIQARHENSAVAMADGYARVAGRLGVGSVTDGPGLANATNSLTIATRHRTPMVVVAGDTGIGEAFHQHDFDQETFVRSTGAAFAPVRTAGTALRVVREACFRARTQPGPVVLSIPIDLQQAELDFDFDYTPIAPDLAPTVSVPAPAEISRLVERLVRAERPVVVAGRGAVESGATDQIKRFAARLGALTGTSLRALGMFRGEPYDLGVIGAFGHGASRRLLADADLVVGVGAGLGYYTTEAGYIYPAAERILIDTNPRVLHQGLVAADLVFQGDATATLAAINAELEQVVAKPGFRSPQVAEELAAARRRTLPAADEERTDGAVHPMRAMWALSDAAPEDAYFVIGTGHFWAFPLIGLAALKPDNYTVEDDYGAIAQGVAMAVGAAVALPGRPVICVEGDGSLLMHVQELETIARHGLDVKIVIVNDGGYGAEVHKLNAKGLDGQLVVFGYTDLAAVARALGIDGLVVDRADLLDQATKELLGTAGAALLDVRVPSDVLSPPYRRLYLGEAD